MRKACIFMIILLLFSPVWSASLSGTTLGKGLSESLTVSLDVEKLLDFVDVGFSRNEINSFDDPVLDLGGTTEALVINEGASYATLGDHLYVYWKVLSSNSITASISIPSALHSAYGDLDWSVGYSDGSVGIASYDLNSKIDVFRHSDSKTLQNTGSAELFINTENLNKGDVIPGVYKGELRLDISVE